MQKSQILKLFMVINQAYPNFEAYEEKVLAWQEFLEGVNYEDAHRCLMNHIRTSSFQPTPADLIPKKEPRTGPYIPNAEETRHMLAEQERWVALPCPEQYKINLPWYGNKNRLTQ